MIKIKIIFKPLFFRKSYQRGNKGKEIEKPLSSWGCGWIYPNDVFPSRHEDAVTGGGHGQHVSSQIIYFKLLYSQTQTIWSRHLYDFANLSLQSRGILICLLSSHSIHTRFTFFLFTQSSFSIFSKIWLLFSFRCTRTALRFGITLESTITVELVYVLK